MNLNRLRQSNLRETGMTLVEVMVALVILTVSTYMLSSTIMAAVAHSEIKRERALAVEAAMNMLESMRAQPFAELHARYNSDPEDDPNGVGTAPGSGFHAVGLDPMTGDADGLVGRILLPSMTKALKEDCYLPELGMPRDLDGDMQIDKDDHALDYMILPVKVTIEWQGGSGRRSFEMSTMFTEMRKIGE
jgi:prepilin-type N-terminal cleavage/methylation domain-containing protein